MATPKKKPVAKKAPAKKVTAKKTVAKKATPKTAAKKTTAKKTTAKKAPVKKTAASKTTAKKTIAKKVVAKKTTAKTPAKKTPAKKEVAKKVAPVKAPTKAEKKAAEKAAIANRPKKVMMKRPPEPPPIKFEKPNLSEKTLEKLKDLLLEERKRHLSQSEELAQEAVELITDREAGDTVFDEESGEGDSVAVERERSLFLSAEARNTVDQIDRALAKMKDGTYSLCTKCGKRISVARLEALPWADVCIECKARTERRY